MPAAAMRGPPMPTSLTVGSSPRRARHKVSPCRSPDASPAESMMTRRSGMATAAHDRDAGPLGAAHGRLPIDDQDLTLLYREGRGAPGRHRFEGGGTDRRDVEAEIMARRHGLDDDGSGTAEARPPPYG